MFLIREKLSGLKRVHTASSTVFNYNTDPGTTLNPDPIRISGSTTLVIRIHAKMSRIPNTGFMKGISWKGDKFLLRIRTSNKWIRIQEPKKILIRIRNTGGKVLAAQEMPRTRRRRRSPAVSSGTSRSTFSWRKIFPR